MESPICQKTESVTAQPLNSDVVLMEKPTKTVKKTNAVKLQNSDVVVMELVPELTLKDPTVMEEIQMKTCLNVA